MAIGKDATKVSQLDDGTGAIAAYAFYNSSGNPVRLLAINSLYYNASSGSSRSSSSVLFSSLSSPSVQLRILTAPSAEAQTSLGAKITVAGRTINSSCNQVGNEIVQTLPTTGGNLTVTLQASEAVFIQL
jgi:hypothetical protein